MFVPLPPNPGVEDVGLDRCGDRVWDDWCVFMCEGCQVAEPFAELWRGWWITLGKYIIRGLKVMLETYWNGETYVAKHSQSRTLECSFRTAVEDISKVSCWRRWLESEKGGLA